jgi:hypothetical protein
MNNNFVPRELKYLRIDNGYSSLSNDEVSVISTIEPASVSRKRDTIAFHVNQFHDIEELAELYEYMNERQCTFIEFYVPRKVKTQRVNRNKEYYFGSEYISKEKALEFCKENNARLLTPEELKHVVKANGKYHVDKENSDGRMYFSLGHGNLYDSCEQDKAKLVAKFL